jgi:hypothetical protein
LKGAWGYASTILSALRRCGFARAIRIRCHIRLHKIAKERVSLDFGGTGILACAA